MTTKRENQLPDYRIVLLVTGFLVIFYLLLPIMAPFLAAAILAYICKPAVDRISLWKLGKLVFGRTTATVITMLLLAGIALLLVLIIVPMLQKELLLMVQRLPDIIDLLRARLEPWLLLHFGISLNIDLNQIQDILSKHWKVASDLITPVLLSISKNGFAIVLWIINLLLVPVVLFYLLRDWHVLLARLHELLPRRIEPEAVKLIGAVDEVLGAFFRGQLLVMLALGVIYTVGLWLVGLDLALLIGMLAGLVSFVPYLGLIVGVVAAGIAALLQFQELLPLVYVLAVFGVAQVLESVLLTPWLLGERIGLHPVAVIFAVMAGGQLFGFLGVLLALPVAAMVVVLLRHAHQHYLDSRLYSAANRG